MSWLRKIEYLQLIKRQYILLFFFYKEVNGILGNHMNVLSIKWVSGDGDINLINRFRIIWKSTS